MCRKSSPVHPKMQEILEAAGVEWSWREKSSHWQLLVNGRVVLTSPRNHQDRDGRQWLNALACVRRACRQAVAR